jgi:hypothetical protein
VEARRKLFKRVIRAKTPEKKKENDSQAESDIRDLIEVESQNQSV